VAHFQSSIWKTLSCAFINNNHTSFVLWLSTPSHSPSNCTRYSLGWWVNKHSSKLHKRWLLFLPWLCGIGYICVEWSQFASWRCFSQEHRWVLQFDGVQGVITDILLRIKNNVHYVSMCAVGNVEICGDVECHHDFHANGNFCFVSKSCTFKSISPLCHIHANSDASPTCSNVSPICSNASPTNSNISPLNHIMYLPCPIHLRHHFSEAIAVC